MCHEEYFRRSRRAADESWAMWQDFERTWPVADSNRPFEVPESERTEPEEEISVTERCACPVLPRRSADAFPQGPLP